MALNNYSTWGYVKAPQLSIATDHLANSRLCVNLKQDPEKCCKWKCRCLPPGALAPTEDENPAENGAESLSNINGDKIQFQQTHQAGFLQNINPLSKPLVANEFSSRHGSKVRVAYKGLPGAYTEDAALKAYPKCETVPCDDFETSFKAVESWLVDKAILPIESSSAGSIHRSYDLLLRHKLHIVGEVQLLINHCLLGLAGVTKEELVGVMSHPQALMQCKKMLDDLGVVNIGVNDIAGAAKDVALNKIRDIGAIAGSRAAKIYGLDILAEGIQDDNVNIARFLVLGRDPIIPGIDGPYKTSIAFNLDEGPGALFKALGSFSLRNINLSKIESRPLKGSPLSADDGNAKYFKYLFYVDFEASMADPHAQYALENLQQYTRFLRVFGCYRVNKTDTPNAS